MPATSRYAFIDLLRVLAAQVIVLHHLAFYGPLSDHAYVLAPATIDWLYEHGRLAVQVFFVTAGYCLATGLERRHLNRARHFVALVVERYFRIGLPYLVALALAIAANELARSLMDHPSISPKPTLGQLATHLVLLHKVFGYDSLTAGIWYVAIDLQLVALVGLVVAISGKVAPASRHAVARYLLLALGLVSAFVWNRVDALDRFGIYFFASYALGMAAAWASNGSIAKRTFWAYLAAMAMSLPLGFRIRLVVAMVVASVLLLAHERAWVATLSNAAPVKAIGRVTYSLFLIHFPICLVINAWWSHGLPADPWMGALGMGLAWPCSLAGAFAFYHLVESRLAHLRLPSMVASGPRQSHASITSNTRH